MRTIFFDIETSDLNFVGQILNYAFVEVDSNWNITSSIRDNVKISPLQLPSPEAILANKIDVMQHQEESSDIECVAMKKIHSYLENMIEVDKVVLIGYNSNSFDVPFVRTSMIRNGLNPYFSGNLEYSDLLHLVRKLALTDKSFLEKMKLKETGVPKLTLESVCKCFGLLSEDESQEHESISDVLLTIKLAKYIHENYNIDIRTYYSYEVNKKPSQFDVIKVVADYDREGNLVDSDYCYYALLEQQRNQSLWINLKLFEEGKGKDSVFWYNKNTSPLLVDEYVCDDSLKDRANRATRELSHINLQNYWPEVNCDVEQHIYMLPINEIRSLHNAIWNKDKYLLKENKNKYANILYLRFLCNTVGSDEVNKMISMYSDYRYGGKMKLKKSDHTSVYEEGVYNDSFHRTYNELIEVIDEKSTDISCTFLMSKLKSFYENSIINILSGEQLKNIQRLK